MVGFQALDWVNIWEQMRLAGTAPNTSEEKLLQRSANPWRRPQGGSRLYHCQFGEQEGFIHRIYGLDEGQPEDTALQDRV